MWQFGSGGVAVNGLYYSNVRLQRLGPKTQDTQAGGLG